jgi:hypothetical protein
MIDILALAGLLSRAAAKPGIGEPAAYLATAPPTFYFMWEGGFCNGAWSML